MVSGISWITHFLVIVGTECDSWNHCNTVSRSQSIVLLLLLVEGMHVLRDIAGHIFMNITSEHVDAHLPRQS